VHIVTTNLHAYVCQQHNNTSALLLCHLQMRDYTNWAPMQTCTYHIMHLTTCHFIDCCRVHVRPVHEAAGYLSTNLACSLCFSVPFLYCNVLYCIALHGSTRSFPWPEDYDSGNILFRRSGTAKRGRGRPRKQ
jgi:hypothetical protein